MLKIFVFTLPFHACVCVGLCLLVYVCICVASHVLPQLSGQMMMIYHHLPVSIISKCV